MWWTRPSAVEHIRPEFPLDPGRIDRPEEPLLPYIAVIGTAFVLAFLAELPDKSMFASLVLGTRYRPSWVWAGAAAAFAVHMAIAVTAGRLLALLPHRVVGAVVAGLFLAGSGYLWVSSFRPGERDGGDAARQGGVALSFWRVAGMSFGVIFLAEWGDITQLTTANLAARYNPFLVFAGATLGLWAVAAVAVSVGAKTLKLIPVTWISRITATILLGLGIYTAVTAIGG
jgi:Ca2+/H+ antiporter, TMEM165/GDT1 family